MFRAASSVMVAMPHGPDAAQRWPFHQSICTLWASPVTFEPGQRRTGALARKRVTAPCLAHRDAARVWLKVSMRSRIGSLAGTVDPSNACGVVRKQRQHCETTMARQADPEPASAVLAAWIAPFASCFTRPTWANVLVLVAGAVLSQPQPLVGQAGARCPFGLRVAAFVPSGPVGVGVKPRGLPDIGEPSSAAGLREPPPTRPPSTKGCPRVPGARQPTSLQRLADSNTPWQRVTVTGWHGHNERRPTSSWAQHFGVHLGKQVAVR